MASYTSLFSVDAAGISVSLYKIVYATEDPWGNPILASGVVGIPAIVPALGVVGVQHGTIMKFTEAPSELGIALLEGEGALLAGFILVMPDYLGFGEATGFLHPHLHAETLGTAGVDALRAARTLLSLLNVRYLNRLFLMGYSEGGFATLAMQKEIEEDPSGEFDLTAVVAGAGTYDLLETSVFLLSRPVQTIPSYQVLFFFSVNETYGLNRPPSDFLNEPFAGIARPLFDGAYSQTEIDPFLSTSTEELFNPQFLSDFSGAGETELKSILKENSLLNWAPRAPTRLWHGRNDTIVPFDNAAAALESFRQRGAPDVEVVPCDLGAGDHFDCFAPYFLYSFGFFLSRL